VKPDSAEVWLADVDVAGPALDRVALQLSLATAQDTARQATLHDPRERERWLRARIILRLLLAVHIGLDAARRPFIVSATGKPAIAGDAGPAFSIAHSGALVLIGIAAGAGIGVDVEVRDDASVDDLRRRAIEAAASALVPEVPLPPTGARRFMQAWTRLEALAKASGQGIGPLLTALGVHGPASSLAVAESPQVAHVLRQGASALRIEDLALDQPAVGAVALGRGASLELRRLPACPSDDADIRRLMPASG
jgi:4'-phosphopantetheinyl transferase